MLDKGLDELDDLLLLAAGELGDLFENMTDLAGRSLGSFPVGGDSDEVIRGCSQGIGQGSDLFCPERDIAAFPGCDHLLGYAESFGQFHLSQTGAQPCFGNALAEFGWFPLERFFCIFHDVSISARILQIGE